MDAKEAFRKDGEKTTLCLENLPQRVKNFTIHREAFGG